MVCWLAPRMTKKSKYFYHFLMKRTESWIPTQIRLNEASHEDQITHYTYKEHAIERARYMAGSVQRKQNDSLGRVRGTGFFPYVNWPCHMRSLRLLLNSGSKSNNIVEWSPPTLHILQYICAV